MSLKGITLNGIPLDVLVVAEDNKEKKDFRDKEILSMSRVIRTHIGTKSNKNHSGARSGKGRVIYSAALGGAL